jgi:hypothetical protein
VIVTGGGSMLLSKIGLSSAFLLNAFSYGFAGFCLFMLYRLVRTPDSHAQSFNFRTILEDLVEGFTYLVKQSNLFHPLLLTLITVAMTGPASSLLNCSS